MMKNLKKLFSLCLVLALCLSLASIASAASVTEATIDTSRTGSLDIYKYDFTNAAKDGVWDSSYVSTGVYDQSVNDALGSAVRAGDTDDSSNLGNGETSYGYAIKGVEFTYLRVADICQFTESAADGSTSNHVEVLYGIDKTNGAALLAAIGLADGAGRYENADNSGKLDSNNYYYQSDVLIDALRASLTSNATTVKNALENYVKVGGGTALPLTDAYGHTSADGLPLGLYLVVETKVPDMVIDTTAPFFVSLPMTSVDGSNAIDGGTRWMYDVTLYPKNLTGIPTLEKALRESKPDTGKHNGSNDIADGYAHTGTASDGDVIDYQLVSTLPSITSESTYLTCYTFVDTLSKGLSYNRNDVVLEFFTDAACTQSVARWTEADGKFTVSYNATAEQESVMTIEMTAAGLAELNTSKAVYTEAGMVNSGYSDCTLRITYTATIHSDASVVYGDTGNPNEVVLTWKRTSSDFYDTLVDDAHVYTYGLELTKLFSDGKGDFSKVEFLIHNDTDNYFVQAELNEAEGIYYVTDHVTAEADATHFIPMSADPNKGKIVVKGLEDDTYTITEMRTDNGYTLLKDDIEVVISQTETTEYCDIYASDVLGLLQNDPRYATIINDTGDLKNMPQRRLEHHLLTASATVDGNAVTMLTDNGSTNAEAPLRVVNTCGFDLPKTGDNGTWTLTICGTLLILCAGGCIVLLIVSKRKKNAKH
ncbi:MAG: SpaH/EbpB family LPXTG-anchored major pilin [Oscillospiraceae bacterium]|nr:SpaH/EbpB family LPXTG-anchored major pilin [Oscillospiraceae bacterium]